MELQIFNYEKKQIRTSTNENGEIVFVAKDVCDALGLDNTSQALARLDDDEKGIYSIDTLGGSQSLWAVTEQGLYELILSSKKLEAKKFKKWLKKDVLPSIRKTGSYSFGPKKIPDAHDVFKSLKETAELFGLVGNQALLSANRATKEVTGVDFQSLLDVSLVNNTQEDQLTPSELGKLLNKSPQEINKRLEKIGYQTKENNKWVAIGEGKKYAVLLDTNKKNSQGVMITQLKWKRSVLELIA